MPFISGGGGGGGPTLLGPYTVTYQQLDPVDHVDVYTYTAGTLVLRTFVIPVASFGAGEAITAKLVTSGGASSGLTEIGRWKVDVAAGTEFTLEGLSSSANGPPPDKAVHVTVAGCTLGIGDVIGGNVGGSAQVYQLVHL